MTQAKFVEHPDLIPIAVVVAVAIFLAKEFIEAFRRWRSNVRKLHAVRRFIAVECERNEFAIGRLLGQAAEIQEALTGDLEVKIEKRESGHHRLVITADDGMHGSAPVPNIHMEMIEKYLFEAASLDAGLFAQMEATLEALIDAAHVRNGFIEYVDEDPEHLEGFPQFAKRELADALDRNRDLYFRCTCEPLAKGRVR
jgi:hypothetical protein